MIVATTFFEQMLAQYLSANPNQATPGLLAESKMGLYTNPLKLTPDTVLTDLVQATFIGYAGPASAVFTGPFRNSQGIWQLESSPVQFTMSNAQTQEAIWGWFVCDPTMAQLYFAETQVAPVNMINSNQRLTVIANFNTRNLAPGSSTIIA